MSTLAILAVVATGAVVAVATAASASRPSATGSGGAPADQGSPRRDGVPTTEDGYIADGDTVSVVDGSARAVTKLDPALLGALQDAARAAESDGLTLRVASGWRSPYYQEWLLSQAVTKYGSIEEASKWVGTPESSKHVAGEAVDVGPFDASDWLDRKGDRFGLCRMYQNETWHFELIPSAKDGGCPPMYPDASQDPRLRG